MAERQTKKYITIDANSQYGWMGGLGLNEYLGRKSTYDPASDAGFDVFRKLGVLQTGFRASIATATIDLQCNALRIAQTSAGTYLYGLAAESSKGSLFRVDTADHGLASMLASWTSPYSENSMEYHNDHLYIPYNANISAAQLAKYGPLSGAASMDLAFNVSLTGNALGLPIKKVVLSWRGNIYVFHANNIDYTDGSTGVLTQGARLPSGMLIKCASDYGSRLAIGASQNGYSTVNRGAECKVYLYDGVSNDWLKEIPFPETDIFDIKFTEQGLLAWGKKYIYKYNGDKGAFTPFEELTEDESIKSGQVDEMNGQVWFSGNNHLKSFGAPLSGLQGGLHKPITATGVITGLKWLNNGKVYMSNTAGNLLYASASNETGISWKTRHIDIGQKFRVAWVRVVTETLASGDGLELSLASEGGSSKVVGTLTHTTDGAVLEKEFFAKNFTADVGEVNEVQVGVKFTGGSPKVRRIDLMLETVKSV